MNELKEIMIKFVESNWDLIKKPVSLWLNDNIVTNELIASIKQADQECGNCGCELDQLYKKALELLNQ